MLREPQELKPSGQLRKDQKSGRFQMIKLEERIAPARDRRGPPEHAQKNK